MSVMRRIVGSHPATAIAIGPFNITDRRVHDALRLISAEFRDAKLTTSIVARRIGISRHFLAHLMKQHTGRSFMHHLHAHRVRHAAALISTTSLSIKEIASAAGYERSGQLEHHFKRFMDMLPSAFRNARREQQR